MEVSVLKKPVRKPFQEPRSIPFFPLSFSFFFVFVLPPPIRRDCQQGGFLQYPDQADEFILGQFIINDPQLPAEDTGLTLFSAAVHSLRRDGLHILPLPAKREEDS